MEKLNSFYITYTLTSGGYPIYNFLIIWDFFFFLKTIWKNISDQTIDVFFIWIFNEEWKIVTFNGMRECRGHKYIPFKLNIMSITYFSPTSLQCW